MVGLDGRQLVAAVTWLSVPRWWLLAVLLTAMTATGLVGVWLVCTTVHDWWRGR